MGTRVWAWLGLVVVVAGTIGGPAAAADRRNAAAWYAAAADRWAMVEATMPPATFRSGMQDLQAAARRPRDAPPETTRQFLRRLEPVLDLVRRGARLDRCDPGLDRARGPEIDLSHLDHLRGFATGLAADAVIRFHADDPQGAAERLAALYRLADHAGEDRLLVSSLLARWIFDLAESVSQGAVDLGCLAAPESRIVLGAVAAIDTDDPFQFRAGIASEQTVMLAWYRDRYEGPEGLALARRDLGGPHRDDVTRAALTVADAHTLEASVAAADHALDLVIEALSAGDPDRTRLELARVDRAVRRGDHGFLARAVLTEYADVFVRMSATGGAASARAAQLAALATGRLDPRAAANAAVWYRRAIAAYEALPLASRERIADYADDLARRIPDEVEADLTRAQEVIAHLREATSLDRCDLAVDRPEGPRGLHGYHAPLRSIARLVLADAVREIQAKRYEGAAERLEMDFRLAGHLSEDGLLMSSRLADAVFTDTFALLAPGLRADVFGVNQRRALLDAARSVGIEDPFGYRRAITSERRGLEAWIAARADAGAGATRQRLAEALDRCPGDQLLFLTLAVGAIDGPGPDAGPRPVGRHPGRVLADLMEIERVLQARREGKTVEQLIDHYRFADLAEPRVPAIARIDDRRFRAPRQVREQLETLEAEELVARDE